jgi:hypothetical protein
LGELLRYREVKVRLGEPLRGDVSGVPAAVGRVHDDGPREEVLSEVAPTLVRQLVGAKGLGGVGIQNLEDSCVHDAVVLEAGVLLKIS